MNIVERKELVKTVLTALPTYLLTALRVPKKFISKLEKTMRQFLWAEIEELHGGKCNVRWVKVTRPVKYSSLGIRNLHLFSRALRLRWLWYEWNEPARAWNGTELRAS